MSYLLTEIALEMLGYKFYDINGVLGQTDFQQTIPSSYIDEAAAEESLQSILGPLTDDLIGEVEDNDAEDKTHAPNNVTTSPSSAESTKKTELLPPVSATVFSTLLDLEYANVRKQLEQFVLRNKGSYMVNRPELLQEMEQRISSGASMQDLLQPFIAQEKEKLQQEVQRLTEFRHLVEERAFRIDRTVYEKYKRAFNSSQQKKTVEMKQ